MQGLFISAIDSCSTNQQYKAVHWNTHGLNLCWLFVGDRPDSKLHSKLCVISLDLSDMNQWNPTSRFWMLILIGAVPERLVHGDQSRPLLPSSLAPPGPAVGLSTATLIQGTFKSDNSLKVSCLKFKSFFTEVWIPETKCHETTLKMLKCLYNNLPMCQFLYFK